MKSILLAAFTTILFTSSAAYAQNTWDAYVASTGSNANLCTRSAPCASFARAFAQTPAAGVIHVVDSGAYGTLTISHGITIDGGGFASTTSAGGLSISGLNQFTINAGAADVVVIENLTLSGSRDAFSETVISVNSVGALHVQNCVFSAFTVRAVDFRAPNGYLTMKNVTISDMASGTGVYVANARALLDNVAVHNTQTGVLAAGSSTVSIAHSTFNGNGTAVAAAYGPTAQLNIDGCIISNNQWAIVVSQGATAYVGKSSLFNNYIKAVFNDGSSFLVSYGTNQFAGNASDGSFTAGMAVR